MNLEVQLFSMLFELQKLNSRKTDLVHKIAAARLRVHKSPTSELDLDTLDIHFEEYNDICGQIKELEHRTENLLG